MQCKLVSTFYINSDFPFKMTRLYINGCKITGSPRDAIFDWWGYTTAKQLYNATHEIPTILFDHIYSHGISKESKHFPKIFHSLLSKHFSKFCAINRQLSRWDKNIKNECPTTCGRYNEDIQHVTRCMDEGRTACNLESVHDLDKWLQDHNTDPDLAHLIHMYLLCHGSQLISEFVVVDSDLHDIAHTIDLLGWDNFLLGRIPSIMIDHQWNCLLGRYTRLTTTSWAAGLIKRLLLLVFHWQWIYCNGSVHLLSLDGKTLSEHSTIQDETKNLLTINLTELLEYNRSLLVLDIDFNALGTGPTENRLIWTASMNTALTAAQHPHANYINYDPSE